MIKKGEVAVMMGYVVLFLVITSAIGVMSYYVVKDYYPSGDGEKTMESAKNENMLHTNNSKKETSIDNRTSKFNSNYNEKTKDSKTSLSENKKDSNVVNEDTLNKDDKEIIDESIINSFEDVKSELEDLYNSI